MTTLDDAFSTPVVVLRPASFAAGAPQPRAALVIRFPGDSTMPEKPLRERVLRALLGQGWELVSAPAGEFETSAATHPLVSVQITGDHVQVESGGQVLFDGRLGLSADMPGTAWLELAEAAREVMVFVTVGRSPLVTGDDVDVAARAGHLVGLPGVLTVNL